MKITRSGAVLLVGNFWTAEEFYLLGSSVQLELGIGRQSGNGAGWNGTG